jgi:hypothetical protein
MEQRMSVKMPYLGSSRVLETASTVTRLIDLVSETLHSEERRLERLRNIRTTIDAGFDAFRQMADPDEEIIRSRDPRWSRYLNPQSDDAGSDEAIVELDGWQCGISTEAATDGLSIRVRLLDKSLLERFPNTLIRLVSARGRLVGESPAVAGEIAWSGLKPGKYNVEFQPS